MAAPLDSWVNAFVDTSFRDAADEDYIAARTAYRLELNQSFLWAALQSVEKYIKAILLYNRQTTLNLGHNVVKGFERLHQIPDIPFQFPPDVAAFLKYINEEGPNRYRGYPAYLRPRALQFLDGTVWYLRRHCYNMKGVPASAVRLAQEVAALRQDPVEYRMKFRIPGGYLEAVLAKPSERRRSLVWKNFWYGSRRKRVIKAFPQRWQLSQPVHFMRPEVYFAVKDLVQFDHAVTQHFAAMTRKGRQKR